MVELGKTRVDVVGVDLLDKVRPRSARHHSQGGRELVRMAGTGEYTIADLAGLFTVSRTTVYRTLQRHDSSTD